MNTAITAATITEGCTALGIELGSTRIKACLVDADGRPLAVGSHTWENERVGGVWTYALDAIWSGVQSAVNSLLAAVQDTYGVRLDRFGAIGVSAMMHGYLAFDAAGELLVPFRTWRNTTTGPAAAELTELLGVNVPLRWSVAHAYQAVLDDESHVPEIAHLTTLAGYVHWQLTGQRVLGVGDAAGMFPVDATTGTYDVEALRRFDAAVAAHQAYPPLSQLLPQVMVAGESAGRLTAAGALLLDPAGRLQAGIPFCPPEGDAGTGMVATNAIAPRTGNVSVGTSVFAMVVLERGLSSIHHEIDVVATPAGDPVAMVHCNNGASELGAWAGVFGEFAAALGHGAAPDAVFAALLGAATEGEPDGGGILSYNHLAGEPVVGTDAGRPLVLRTPDSALTLANFARSQVYGVFGTLSLGMRVLRSEGVTLDAVYAHGGLFRTEQVAQRLLAAALGVPVAVGAVAGEGGAWGAAVLAAYLHHAHHGDLASFLANRVFTGEQPVAVAPDVEDSLGYATFLDRYEAGLAVERAAIGVNGARAVRAEKEGVR